MTAVLERDESTGSRTGIRRVFSDTPHQLKLLTAGLAVLALLLGVVAALGLGRDSSSLSDLKSRTSEVSATNDLYYRLNDMDAQAADVLLVGYHPANPAMVPQSVDAASSDANYELDRSRADADLEQIARNTSLTTQASDLLDSLGRYEALVAQALYIDQQGQNEAPATPPAAALSLYKQASDLLHGSLLPASQTISNADIDEVDGSYSANHSAITLYGYALLVLALATVAALLLGNRYHHRKFKRRIGFLAVGCVFALVLGLVGLGTQLAVANDVHVAKQDAYDSVYALTQAQAVADDANADESRWLLEGRDPSLQSSFFQNMTKVGGVPSLTYQDAAGSPSSYYQGLGKAVGGMDLDVAANTASNVTITGYLGSELDNITFPGEAQAAVTATQAFNQYAQDDGTIRQDADAGDLAAAVGYDIGLQKGQSNYDFTRFTNALGSVVQINQSYFDSAAASGQSDAGAGSWTLLVVLLILLVACIGQAGYLRLREYR